MGHKYFDFFDRSHKELRNICVQLILKQFLLLGASFCFAEMEKFWFNLCFFGFLHSLFFYPFQNSFLVINKLFPLEVKYVFAFTFLTFANCCGRREGSGTLSGIKEILFILNANFMMTCLKKIVKTSINLLHDLLPLPSIII